MMAINEDFDAPVYEEYEAPETKEDKWLATGWHRSRNKPGNICKYLKGVGLCTVFPSGSSYKFVAGGEFYGPYSTQEDAQLAAKKLIH
jgi:hypothetical protein